MVRSFLKTGDVLFEGYTVGKPIALGGYAVVYAGERVWDERPVVIKCPRQDVSQVDPSVYARFEREARAAQLLEHPNVVRTLEFGTLPNGTPYIVLERLFGVPLNLLMYRRPLAEAKVLPLLWQTLCGLQAAHCAGIAHRDLKPGNIFVCTDQAAVVERDPNALTGAEPVKLLDFGLVKGLDDSDPDLSRPLTRAGRPVGTAGYVAPEALAGAPASPQADLYALGIIAYELLTGQQAYRGSSREKLQAQLTSGPPAPDPELGRQQIFRVVTRLLDRRPEFRFAEAAEVKAALRALMPHATRLGA